MHYHIYLFGYSGAPVKPNWPWIDTKYLLYPWIWRSVLRWNDCATSLNSRITFKNFEHIFVASMTSLKSRLASSTSGPDRLKIRTDCLADSLLYNIYCIYTLVYCQICCFGLQCRTAYNVGTNSLLRQHYIKYGCA